MVRKRVLVPLLAAAALLLAATLASSIHERATPSGDGCGGGDSTAGGPCTGGCGWDPGFCLPVSGRVMQAVFIFLGALMGKAWLAIFDRFADNDGAQASGAAKKAAGYVAIADDPEAGTSAGGKN